MSKGTVFLEGVDTNFIQLVEKFMAEWESYSGVITISTSGSTGTPKPIQFRKKQLEASAKYTGRFFDFKAGENLLLNLSPEFVAGKLMLVRGLVHQMNIIVAPLKENPLADLKSFPDKIKLAAFVPHQVQAILKSTTSKSRYNEIENVIIGGAEISSDLEMEISKQQTKSYATFGMTETLTHFALRRLDGESKVYECLPGISIAKDERGCLIVHANEIIHEPLITNDVIDLIDSSHFIWKGRIDFLINSGGVKIQPEEDEKKIAHLLPNDRFYISSRKHTQLGEEVLLIVEGDKIPNDDQLLLRIKEQLPAYHAPKEIVYLKTFEQTSNGKVKRKKF